MNTPRPFAAASRGVRSLSREVLRLTALVLSATLVIVLLLMALDWGTPGVTGAAALYEYLKKYDGIAIPHTSATGMSSGWL